MISFRALSRACLRPLAAAVVAGAALGALPLQAEVSEPPLPKVNARALYVSCYLFAQGADVPRPAADRAEPFSAITCALYGAHAVGLREGRPDVPGGFCMGKTPNAGREMATAYVLYSETHPFTGEPPDGEPRFRDAMQWRWPCGRK